MKIAVIGIGLIGGSICRALKKNTSHYVMAMDIDKTAISAALNDGSIDTEISDSELNLADLTIVCLYPQATIDFIVQNADNFAKKSIVIDVCGIKGEIVTACTDLLFQNDVTFIGTHPMAGREYSGYEYSSAELFAGASFIMTPTLDTPQHAVFVVSMLAEQLRFGKIVISTSESHDSIIAFTSQLAHIVSNAYVKSPTIDKREGFSAGSFQDLTRVAQLNEEMWSSLFVLNKQALLFELDNIINKLAEYKSALEKDDINTLKSLLKQGSEIKKRNN